MTTRSNWDIFTYKWDVLYSALQTINRWRIFRLKTTFVHTQPRRRILGAICENSFHFTFRSSNWYSDRSICIPNNGKTLNCKKARDKTFSHQCDNTVPIWNMWNRIDMQYKCHIYENTIEQKTRCLIQRFPAWNSLICPASVTYEFSTSFTYF